MFRESKAAELAGYCFQILPRGSFFPTKTLKRAPSSFHREKKGHSRLKPKKKERGERGGMGRKREGGRERAAKQQCLFVLRFQQEILNHLGLTVWLST